MKAQRAGFSLLEVLLATAILLGAAIVLAELAAIGRKHADSAELYSAAQRICQTKMNELLCGASPLEKVDKVVLEDEPGWVYTVEIEPVDEPGLRQGLAALRVTVAEDVAEQQQGKQCTLVRWIRDPYWESGAEGDLAEPGMFASPLLPEADGGPQP